MSVSRLMKEYFSVEEAEEIPIFRTSQSMPVIPFKETWEVAKSPNRLMKDFKFENFFQLQNFLNEILQYQEQINHHAKLTIDHLEIRVEIYTRDIDEITEIDIEYSKNADLIYDDIQYYEDENEFRYRGS